MLVIPKLQQMEEAIGRKTTHSSLRMLDMVVMKVPTMEILTGRKRMKAESLRGMTVMKDHQMTMIHMMMTTMETAEMMTPQVVMAIPYQAAVTPNVHMQT